MTEPTFNRYLIEYPYEGATWNLEIKAASRADAEERLKALPWARLLGEIAYSASTPESWFTRQLAKLFRPRS